MTKNKRKFNPLEALDGLLKDIASQIQSINDEQKDVPYLKLIELLYKGIDLKEKLSGKVNEDKIQQKIKIIKGVDESKI